MTPRAKQYVDFINAHLKGQSDADLLGDFIEVHGIAFDEHDLIHDFEQGDDVPPLFIVTATGGFKKSQKEALQRATKAALAHVYAKETAP